MSVKILNLEVSDFKRIKAARIELTGKSLTVIGGRNRQGKTSILDAIVYVLGGERKRPSNLKREGAENNPGIKLTLSNGLVVERDGKNSVLKVTDPDGRKGGQSLLNEFVSSFSIDLPKFMNANDSDKARMLLQTIGIEGELKELEEEEEKLYGQRHRHGQTADQVLKTSRELPHHPELPNELISAAELIKSQQGVMRVNAENETKRNNVDKIKNESERLTEKVAATNRELAAMKKQVAKLEGELEEVEDAESQSALDLYSAQQAVEGLEDQSTKELETKLEELEETNDKIRENIAKKAAIKESERMEAERKEMTAEVNEVREKRIALLEGANMPLEGLSVESSKLTYNGKFWDCMSGSEQLQIGTAIARKVNEECGFVLIDKAEQFDAETLEKFGAWLESEDLQAIATRVSTGPECSIIIEDGEAV